MPRRGAVHVCDRSWAVWVLASGGRVVAVCLGSGDDMRVCTAGARNMGI